MLFEGNVSEATLTYIIRDFNSETFAHRKNLIHLIVERKNIQYPNAITLELKDQYYNMASKIADCMEIVDLAKQAMEACGITPSYSPSAAVPMVHACPLWDFPAPISLPAVIISMDLMNTFPFLLWKKQWK